MIKKILVLSVVLMFAFASAVLLTADQERAKITKVKPVKKVMVKRFSPDLTITFCSHLESNIKHLKVTVKNIGKKASMPCKLLVEDLTNKSQPKKYEVNFPGLGPKPGMSKPNLGKAESVAVAKKKPMKLTMHHTKTIIVKCPWPVYNRVILATIDSKNLVKESREDNNKCWHSTVPK